MLSTTLLALVTASQVGLGTGYEPPPRAPRHQVSLEVAPLVGALGYAFRVGPNTSLGLKLGFGIDGTTSVPIGGGHFADDWGYSYQERDGATQKRFIEIAQAAVFVRQFLSHGFHVEVGGRMAGGIHKDSSDDDAGGAEFMGAYGSIFWGGSIVSVGTRVSAGLLSEWHKREVAVVLNPIILKLTTP